MKLQDVKQNKLSKKLNYNEELLKLQYEALEIQRTYVREKRRALIVLEGWDAAGKGGLIRRLTEKLDPRHFRVHTIAAPNPREQARHYMYRFWRRVLPPGRIDIYDRSWYGRVLVERIEGFCDEAAWRRAYGEINDFETSLAEEDVRIIKIFLHISKEEQLERFLARYQDPRKRWKLTAEDFRNRDKWAKYEEAINEMLEKCSTEVAPWHVIGSNSKKSSRIEAMTLINTILSEGLNITEPPVQEGVREWVEKIAPEIL